MNLSRYPNVKFAIIPTIVATLAMGAIAWGETRNGTATAVTAGVMAVLTFVCAGMYSATSKVQRTAKSFQDHS
jgi:hypothetical protein